MGGTATGQQLLLGGVELGADVVEQTADLSAQRLHGNDRSHRDERREKRVLDQVLATLFTNETNDEILHADTPCAGLCRVPDRPREPGDRQHSLAIQHEFEMGFASSNCSARTRTTGRCVSQPYCFPSHELQWFGVSR